MSLKRRILVFLSHSSRDKAFVRRINNDLKSRNIETWLDEQNVPLGSSIAEGVQQGLSEADVVLVFLSQASVASRWVSTEWQSKFFSEMREGNTIIVPVLVNECEIPHFLRDRRHLDFRKKEEYEAHLSELLSFLESVKSQRAPERTIESYTKSGSIFQITKDILDDLESEQISLPVHKRIPLIGTLKTLPRSGKKVRLAGLRPPLRIRSIYDHLLSIAHLADCVLPHIEHRVPDQEYADIALCIAYHELNEVVLGDIPTYTSLTTQRRNSARIYAEERLRTVSPAEREQISNNFIWMFLSDKHRRAFEATNKILEDPASPTFVMFKSLDKIDPIVATWRYLHVYRGKLEGGPQEFQKCMKDFFENPDIRAYLRANRVDPKLIDFAMNLQDRRKAWDYYEDPERIFGNPNLFQISPAVARRAVEGIPLFVDDPRPVRRSRGEGGSPRRS